MAIWRRKHADPEPLAPPVGSTGNGAYAVYLAPNDRGLAVVRDDTMTLHHLREDRLVPRDLPSTVITGFQPISWSASSEWLAYIDQNAQPQLLHWSTGETTSLLGA